MLRNPKYEILEEKKKQTKEVSMEKKHIYFNITTKIRHWFAGIL